MSEVLGWVPCRSWFAVALNCSAVLTSFAIIGESAVGTSPVPNISSNCSSIICSRCFGNEVVAGLRMDGLGTVGLESRESSEDKDT